MFLITIILTIFQPCVQEDSPNCYWDAKHQGNGVGHSFIDFGGYVVYLD